MRMTYAEPFSTRAITASLAKLRIDQASVENAIRRTVADLARQPTPALARSENVPAPAPRRAVRRTVAKVATSKAASVKFPGIAPEAWEDLDAEQLRWFRERYPGSLELRLSKIAKGQQPINSPSYVVVLLAKYRTKRPFVDKSPDYKADRERIDGLAYVLKGDWSDPQNKHHTQHVFETDPFLYDAAERKSCRYRIGPPQAWQAEWRRAHFVSVESVA